MTKELYIYKKEYNKIITNISIIDNGVEIEFTDNKLRLTDFHNQSCCEDVYADFSIFEYYKKDLLIGKEIRSLLIKRVEKMGFLLCFNINIDNDEDLHIYDDWIKIFIPCYNINNGYYGDDLELTIEDNDTTIKVDIAELTDFGGYEREFMI